jgi:hypothetical protein
VAPRREGQSREGQIREGSGPGRERDEAANDVNTVYSKQ